MGSESRSLPDKLRHIIKAIERQAADGRYPELMLSEQGGDGLLPLHDAIRALELAPSSEIREPEGYPGIAHDLETMRTALITIRDECFSGNAYDIAVRALTDVGGSGNRQGACVSASARPMPESSGPDLPAPIAPSSAIEQGTPRTDAALDVSSWTVSADFARQLEQELSDAKADVLRLHREKMDLLFGADGFPRSSTTSAEPDAYLIEYREVSQNGDKKHCVEASLEPRTPTICGPDWERVETRELIKATPLYKAQRSTVERGERERLKEIEHLAWHLLEDSEHRQDNGEVVVLKENFDALSKLLPEEHP